MKAVCIDKVTPAEEVTLAEIPVPEVKPGGVYTLDGFDQIKEIPNGVYLTGFFSNYPTQQTVDEIIAFLNEHKSEPCFGECFDLEHIRDACIALDSGKVNGKIVVKMS